MSRLGDPKPGQPGVPSSTPPADSADDVSWLSGEASYLAYAAQKLADDANQVVGLLPATGGVVPQGAQYTDDVRYIANNLGNAVTRLNTIARNLANTQLQYQSLLARCAPVKPPPTGTPGGPNPGPITQGPAPQPPATMSATTKVVAGVALVGVIAAVGYGVWWLNQPKRR